jgi:hypothetical protein
VKRTGIRLNIWVQALQLREQVLLAYIEEDGS